MTYVMKQVRATMGDRPVTKDDLVTFLNRTVAPLLKELRRRFNERHGEYRRVTADHDVQAGDEFVSADCTDNPITVTLRRATDARCWVTVKKVDNSANAVVVASEDLIDGVASVSFTTQYYAVTFVSNGASYEIQSEFEP